MILRSRVIFVLVCACTSSSRDERAPVISDASETLRGISNAEALVDFDTIANAFRSLYGAMERKQQRYGFAFEDLVREYRARVQAAKDETAYRGIFQEFISRFEDAHVSLSAALFSDDADHLGLPFLVMPVEDTYVVYAAKPEGPVAIGEELLGIDGRSVRELEAEYTKYVGNPNALAKKHFAAYLFTQREVYVPKTAVDGAQAVVELRGVDGQVRAIKLAWSKRPHPTQAAPRPPQAGMTTRENALALSGATAELTQIQAREPFFFTAAVAKALGGTEVKPAGLPQAAAAVDYFALKYTVEGKRVLLVRIPHYFPEDPGAALDYLRALFAQEQASSDVLVLDQTHNPGGNLFFAGGVLDLLAKQTYDGYVQAPHADRKWLEAFVNAAATARANQFPPEVIAAFDAYVQELDQAYSSGASLAPVMPFFADTAVAAPDAGHWTKPIVLLADELSVSCGDLVPLVFKKNKMGVLFGQTTMGGGGNVEVVTVLPNTQAELALSRGLGTVFDPSGAYPEALFVEDNGVTPDVVYSHTLADFRAGYLAYVAAFNATAVQAASGR